MYLKWATQRYLRKGPVRWPWSWTQKRHAPQYFLPEEHAATYSRYTIRRTVRLVTCIRCDGKPRQWTVAYLGSINESLAHRRDGDTGDSNLWHDVTLRRRFWREVTKRLDALVTSGAISAEAREDFACEIHARIPKPTTEEEAAAQAVYAAGMEAVAAAIASEGM